MSSVAAVPPVLVLGGTAEARELAAALVAAGRPVITSLAGRVRDPALPAGEVRVGGFSSAGRDGLAGLAAYLIEREIGAVVDATHPFAATISANAAAATRSTGTPLLRLQRPSWRNHPDAGRWTWLGSVEEAVVAGAAAARPFLTTGRQSLEAYLGRAFPPSHDDDQAQHPHESRNTGDVLPTWVDKEVTVRVVDPPEFVLPRRWRVIRSRGPYAYANERALLSAAGTDLLVTKDSGGSFTAAKLDAARDLSVPVLVIARPAPPAEVPQVGNVAEVLGWLG